MGPVEQGLKEGSKSHWMASKFATEGEGSIVAAIREELEAEDTKVKNAAAKTLSHLAGRRPEWFRDDIDHYLGNLRSERNILRWAAMDIAGHLVASDTEGKIGEDVLDVMVEALSDESMVTAGHGIDNLARIGVARSGWQSQILAELFRVESIPRAANCREVLLGKVADALGNLLPTVSEVNRAAVVTFLNRLAMSDGQDGKKAIKALKRS